MIKFHRVKTISIFSLLLLISAPLSSQALSDSMVGVDDSLPTDIVYYGGRRAIFLASENLVVLLDSAWVRYRDMSVLSDSIYYDIKSHILSAYHSVRFKTTSEEVIGTELHYNVDTRKGLMRNARTKVENGYLTATEVWLVKEKVINARAANYTTCDREHPHYTFFGPRVKLLMDDIAITEPVLLKIGKVPLLAAPFWLVPVASKRKSGLMPFKVGNSLEQGYYAKGISYYWVINDYADITFFLDLMTRKGVQFRTEAVYIVNPYTQGSIQASYIREAWATNNRGRPRYSFNLANNSKPFPRTEIDLQTELISDTAYAPDYAEDRLDWLKQEVYSYGALRHRFLRIGKLSLRVEDHTYYMRHYRYSYLPIISFNFDTRTIPRGWDISPSIGFSRRFERFDSSGTDTLTALRLTPGMSLNLTSPDYVFGRIEIADQLSFSHFQKTYYALPIPSSQTITHNFTLATGQKLFGFLNTSEGITIRQEDNITDTIPIEPRWTLSLNGNFSLYRVFSTRMFNISGILHTVAPSFQFNYEPTITPHGFIGKPAFLKPVLATLVMGIGNGFQAKLGTAKQKVDLGTVNFSSAFNVVEHRLMPINAALSARPLAIFPQRDSGPVRNRFSLYLDGNLTFRPESLEFDDNYSTITTFSWSHIYTDTIHQRENGFELRANHTWGKNQNMLTGSLSFSFAGWRLGLNSLGYNFVQKQLTDYSINLWRDLHCWEAIATVSGLGKQWRYDFEVRIKNLPDVRFGKSTFRTFLP